MSQFLGKENLKNTQRLHTLIEIDLPLKAYRSLFMGTASYGMDTASYGTYTVSYGTNMVGYDSSGKKGLPALSSLLPPTLVYFAVMQPGLFLV